MNPTPNAPQQPGGLTADGIALGDRLIPDGPPRQADASAQQTRAAAMACLMGLFALCVAWELWLAPTGTGTLALKALPLLLPLLGLWRYRMYTYRWLSLLVWLYVGEGLVRASSEGGLSRWLAVAEVMLGVAVFVACVMHVRGRLTHLREEQHG